LTAKKKTPEKCAVLQNYLVLDDSRKSINLFYQSNIIWTVIRLTFDNFWREHFLTLPTIAELQVFNCFRGITLFYMFNFISEKPSAW